MKRLAWWLKKRHVPLLLLYALPVVIFLTGPRVGKYLSYTPSDTIYLLTGIAVALYTVETWRLRRETQLQTELQNRPYLSLDWIPNDQRFTLTNIGKGIAMNVTVVDVEVKGEPAYRLRVRPITYLAIEEPRPLPWTTLQIGADGQADEIPANDDLPDRLLARRGGTVRLSYNSIVPRDRHEQVLEVAPMTDEAPEPRITLV